MRCTPRVYQLCPKIEAGNETPLGLNPSFSQQAKKNCQLYKCTNGLDVQRMSCTKASLSLGTWTKPSAPYFFQPAWLQIAPHIITRHTRLSLPQWKRPFLRVVMICPSSLEVTICNIGIASESRAPRPCPSTSTPLNHACIAQTW